MCRYIRKDCETRVLRTSMNAAASLPPRETAHANNATIGEANYCTAKNSGIWHVPLVRAMQEIFNHTCKVHI